MASIRKRGNAWQARVRRSGFPDEAQSFNTRQEAQQWVRQIEGSMDEGRYVSHSQLGNILFGELISRYIKTVTPTKRGASEETIRLNAMLRYDLAKTGLVNLTPNVIAAYRDQRLQHCKPSTVLRDLVVVSAIINHARREWGIRMENPVAMIRKPAQPQGRDRVINHEEEAALLEVLRPAGRLNPVMHDLVVLALETAMRRGELLALRWEHVDLLRRVAFLPITKNGKSRLVPLSSRAVKTLQAMQRTSGVIFPINAAAMEANWARARRRANLPGIRFHDLRHTAATRISAKLPNVIELAAVTGHTSLQMLKRYYHPQAEALAKKLG